MSVCNMSVCSPCIWLQSIAIEQPQALLLASIKRTVIWLFKVIDMCTPWSLETHPRSKILAKTLRLRGLSESGIPDFQMSWNGPVHEVNLSDLGNTYSLLFQYS